MRAWPVGGCLGNVNTACRELRQAWTLAVAARRRRYRQVLGTMLNGPALRELEPVRAGLSLQRSAHRYVIFICRQTQ